MRLKLAFDLSMCAHKDITLIHMCTNTHKHTGMHITVIIKNPHHLNNVGQGAISD